MNKIMQRINEAIDTMVKVNAVTICLDEFRAYLDGEIKALAGTNKQETSDCPVVAGVYTLDQVRAIRREISDVMKQMVEPAPKTITIKIDEPSVYSQEQIEWLLLAAIKDINQQREKT